MWFCLYMLSGINIKVQKLKFIYIAHNKIFIQVCGSKVQKVTIYTIQKIEKYTTMALTPIMLYYCIAIFRVQLK